MDGNTTFQSNMNNSSLHAVNLLVIYNSNNSTVKYTEDGFTSAEAEDIFRRVLEVWITSILAYFGIGTNVLNLIVFFKLGYDVTINISLTAIAIWDLVRCVCFALIGLYGPISLVSSANAQSWKNFMTLIVGLLHNIAGHASGVLAGYVAVERCISISRPLTVNRILTRKFVTWTSVILSFIVTASYVGAYALYRLTWEFSPEYNQSVLVVKYSRYCEENPSLNVYINVASMFWPISSLVLISICTFIIFVRLRQASLRRSQITTQPCSDKPATVEISARDRQVIKMLLVIIAMYIVFAVPRVIFYTLIQVMPGFRLGGKFNRTFWVYIYFLSVVDAFNSSVNLIVYYVMSTTFRTIFRENALRCWRRIICS